MVSSSRSHARWRANLLLAAAAAFVALAVCEIALRLSGYRPVLTDRDLYVANDSPLLPYKLRAGYRGPYLGQEVEIDGAGWRIMRPATESRPPGETERVILLVGDSIVFGHGLPSDATLGAQLQNALWARDLRYDVRSIGAAGYGSWNEYAAVEEYLRGGSADLVVLIYVSNDVSLDDDQLGIGRGEYATRGDGWFHRSTQALYRHLAIAYFGVDRLRALLHHVRGVPGAAKVGAVNEQALAHSLDGLERLADLCRQRGAALRVGIYRDVWHFDDPQGSLRYEDAVAQALRARGIVSFAIASHVAQLDRAAARRAWNDPHPSAAAVRWMAEDVLRAVEQVPFAAPAGQG